MGEIGTHRIVFQHRTSPCGPMTPLLADARVTASGPDRITAHLTFVPEGSRQATWATFNREDFELAKEAATDA